MKNKSLFVLILVVVLIISGCAQVTPEPEFIKRREGDGYASPEERCAEDWRSGVGRR